MSAVRLNRPACDREPQSDSALFARAAGVDAIKAIENAIPVRGGNPWSRISYLNHGFLIRCIHLDGDRAAVWSVFYRVVDQIHERMSDKRGVAHGMDWDRSSKRELLLLFVGEHVELIDNVSCQFSKVQVLWGQLDFSPVGSREDQKALDEPRQPVDFLQHAADDVAVCDGIKGVLQRHLTHAAHCGERGPQLVRSIGRETAQSFERILQTG